MGEKPVEIEVYENIDDISLKIKQSTFAAYITLEGTFQGIERITSNEIPSMLQEITGRTKHKCLFTRLSLRGKAGQWDEVLLLICNGTVMGASCDTGGEELVGRKCLDRLAANINSNSYIVGIVELTELPIDFLEKRLGVSVKEIGIAEKEVKAEKKPRLVSRPSEEVEKVIEGEERSSVTIPVETSIEKTEILPLEEARKFLPPSVLPALNIPGVRQPEKKEAERKPTEPMRVEEIVQLDQSVLLLQDRLVELTSKENINIIQAVLKGDREELTLELSITKLGLTRRRAKMLSLANSIADMFAGILKEGSHEFKKITVIVRHGYDAVKVTRTLS